MEIFIIIIILIFMGLIIRFKKKSSSELFLESNNSDNYSKESILILSKYFGNKNFNQNINIEDLKNKLEIKSSYKKDLETILKSTLHSIEIHYNFSINKNKKYTNSTTLKLSANEVLDYSIKNNFTIKKSIILMFLTINNDLLKEKLDGKLNEMDTISFFYKLIPDFIIKYNNKI